ncbi:hypothetical protein R3P38DRAFT_610907 [Favolaschia claudopus]|uniref:Uncharacterized protein n=1 Tax=Favolaschia claudopus TaxID=2862362 RepID=A0AAW0CDN6_9AGAR
MMLNFLPSTGSRAVPVYCASVSSLILFLHATIASFVPPLVQASSSTDSVNATVFYKKLDSFSLPVTLARLFGCAVLVALAFIGIVQENTNLSFSNISCQLCLVYVYTFVLASIPALSRRWSAEATRHLKAILIVICLTLAYRNLFPLATYGLPEQDISEGWLLWVKLALTTAIGVVLPLLLPREPSWHKVADPIHSPEETSSLISLVTYSFLNPTVSLASRLPHLPYDLLPPLASRNDARYLKTETFPVGLSHN